MLEHVRAELRFWKYTFPTDGRPGTWALERSFKGDGIETLRVAASDANLSDEIWLTTSSYITPTTYSRAMADAPEQKERLKVLLREKPHAQITPEIRRERFSAKTRGDSYVVPQNERVLLGKRDAMEE